MNKTQKALVSKIQVSDSTVDWTPRNDNKVRQDKPNTPIAQRTVKIDWNGF